MFEPTDDLPYDWVLVRQAEGIVAVEQAIPGEEAASILAATADRYGATLREVAEDVLRTDRTDARPEPGPHQH